MALSFPYRSACARGKPARVALLPGAWNPPTIAHVAIAQAAKKWADEVVLVLPRTFPHKTLEGAPFGGRVEMLRQIASEQGFSVALSDGGLYVEMAGEAAETFGADTEIGLVCGRDAAERIAGWDYGRPGVFTEMLERCLLLVAGRAGDYVADTTQAHRILPLRLEPGFSEVSSTEIRRRISAGECWRQLVPPVIVNSVAKLYSV